MLIFDRATTADLPVVLDILNEAAGWLRAQGIVQWPDRFDVDGWRLDRIRTYVESGQTFVVRDDGAPIATFTLSSADPDFDDGWTDDDGLHIFRMAIVRDWAGHDVGTRILNWASVEVKRRGFSWLRLDCHRDNRRLQLYYENHGFEHVTTVEHPVRKSGSLYQRRAGVVTEGATMNDRYDPTGEAAIWRRAAQLISEMKIGDEAHQQWDAAIDQAARALDSEAIGVRQNGGMYFRQISGTIDPSRK